MQPQQTDVLDVDGPPVFTPSIVEDLNVPQSPADINFDLFDIIPVHTGPVTVIEPPSGVETPADEIDVLPAVEPLALTGSADGVVDTEGENLVSDDVAVVVADALEPAPSDVSLAGQGADLSEPDVVAPSTEITVVPDSGADAELDVRTAPAVTVMSGADPVETPVEASEPVPEEPLFSVSLEDLETFVDANSTKKTPDQVPPMVAETVVASSGDPVDPVTEGPLDPDTTPAPAAPSEPNADEPDVRPVIPELPVVTEAEPTAHTVSKTATYEDIQNSKQEFEGALKVKKFPLIDPDQYWVMIVALVALSGILAANLTSSFTSVYAMAAYIGLPSAVQWLPVVTLDVAIVGFSWALMVFGARGDKVWTTRLYLFVVTGFSVVANFMHTFTFWHGHLSTPEEIFGVVFSSAVPVFSLVATEELIRLVFIRRIRRTLKAVK